MVCVSVVLRLNSVRDNACIRQIVRFFTVGWG